MFRSDARGKGAGGKDEKGKKNFQRDVELSKKSVAGTSGIGTGRRSAAAIVAPAAASTPKPSAAAESGPSLQPKPVVTTTESSARRLAPASVKAAHAAADANMKLQTEEEVSTTSGGSQFVSPATGLLVARVRHASPGHAISVQERGQLARYVFIWIRFRNESC